MPSLPVSILMRPQEEEEILQACKAMGFKIALDDFGTGYSSLSYHASHDHRHDQD